MAPIRRAGTRARDAGTPGPGTAIPASGLGIPRRQRGRRAGPEAPPLVAGEAAAAVLVASGRAGSLPRDDGGRERVGPEDRALVQAMVLERDEVRLREQQP